MAMRRRQTILNRAITPDKILQKLLAERGASPEEDDDNDDVSFVDNKPKVFIPRLRFTDDQLRDMKYTFELLDEECKGLLRENHLRVALRALGFEPKKDDIKQMIAVINEDGTERISFNDFVKLMEMKMGEKDTETELRKSFRLFCGSGESTLTLDDLKRVSFQLKENLNEEQLTEMFEHADVDGNGKINEDDFVKLVLGTVLYPV
ncbi:caltractin-like [Teleopsis dalmanni]|uniref:caltractin-like n=1 Tax=Teleopsis dalmanni TaxID=139649 RepID=UPI0018CD456B|nr:caltractin-like [Teleopsis dalmanni]XP_037952914.1 caltractin-like [Teleopsis dalmanni]